MYTLELTPEAVDDLTSLRKVDQTRIVSELELQLTHQPTQVTRNRKRLRTNSLAEWELRIDDFRAFYDVVENPPIVKVVAIGYKQGSKLFIHGEEFHL